MNAFFSKLCKKHDTSMTPIILVVLLIFGLTVYGFTSMIVYLNGWRTFKENLLEDVGYAMQNHSLSVTVDGEEVIPSSDGGSEVLSIIVNLVKMGKTLERDDIPTGERGICLNYGNGDCLYIEKKEINTGDGITKTGLLLTYCRNGEVSYCYDADKLMYYNYILSNAKQ